MEITEIEFDKGTLLIRYPDETTLSRFPMITWDERVRVYRAPALLYREIILFLRNEGKTYEDKARNFETRGVPLKEKVSPRSYQEEALAAWVKQGSRGVVTLPTGAGKTILAVLAIAKTNRPTLIHVPTLDLMHQWFQVLTRFFGDGIGLLGGGYNDLKTLTVATYDSALIHVPHRGNQFGMLVFDECHHLPGEQLQYTALSSIAPFRLGLTATPERSDGRERLLYEICGPLCYEASIRHLEGKTLAPYEVRTLEVEMTEEEREEYETARNCYLDFVKANRIDFSQPNGFQLFIRKASRGAAGKAAFQAFLKQKRLSQGTSAKENTIWELLTRHSGERILIFTQDNETAYRIGKRFFLPVLTHHTKVKEREEFLASFRRGEYSVIVTSKVLNEGVDVPEASVAIIISGSGSVREHVQRLGRILRSQPGKKAILYEVLSANTSEFFVNRRRKQHSAYQKPAP